MSAQVTLCVTTAGRAAAFALMLESFLKHHKREDVRLHVLRKADIRLEDGRWANFDDDRDYVYANADLVLEEETRSNMVVGSDRLTRTSETPFTLLLDDDIQFHGPVVTRLTNELADFVYPASRCSLGEHDAYGIHFIGQPRIEPYCAMCRTKSLHRLMDAGFSWSPYWNMGTSQFWDGGGMMRMAALAAGMNVVACDWIWPHVEHFGSITWIMNAPLDSENYAIGTKRYSLIKERLETLRNDRHIDRAIPND